jgi:putative heme-binding domain-containing protein
MNVCAPAWSLALARSGIYAVILPTSFFHYPTCQFAMKTMQQFILVTLGVLAFALPSTAFAQVSTSFDTTVEKLSAQESQRKQQLFNGKDLAGWQGDANRWSVVDGTIRGANDNQVPSSTYLFTDKSYRNFRLLLEVKQTMGDEYSTMHSAVCALGERFTDKGDNAYGFKGPLLMFCHDWGIWDAYRRNRVVDRGPGPQVEKKGDWNLIEILVIGNRIRFAANGTQVFDFTDKPEMLQESPIGLQLHSNGQAQEYRFRGLVLTENPEDRLITAKATYTQKVEVQEAVERGVESTETETPETDLKSEISDLEFNSGPNAQWVWGDDNQSDYVLKTTFNAANVKSARLKASCDNVGTVFINGKQVATSDAWAQGMSADVTKHLSAGKNTISAKVSNQGGIAAFVLKLAMKEADGKLSHVVTSGDWTVGDDQKVAGRGDYGDGPWGKVFDGASEQAGRVPRGVFEVLPGFQVEKLFTVPKEELGSWVCIAFDNKGRLLASDQGNLGICRITPPAVKSGETVVERLDFSKCECQPSGAHGMLWAFDSLYFCCNGGPGSGLYRARDTDGDDQFDECVKLKEFRGGGEHGPHSIRLSPDGKRIFVIAGNHTDPPFNPGEEDDNKNYSSRIPTNWGEDHLLPRMWDANGHARGKLAPGGWIASTDPDGKTWDIWSVGYRNPYDMAFNADGELFAYDADMEWDVGSPWYRPTRVVHATSGSEFGWRSGTGKWPTYYLDSLPPLVDIGPGSPVGVDFGYGLKFPAKYQKALYICDWTFGTMYAIHTEPHLSSYKATKEEFVSRTPLPLTDCAAGPDGALYFTIGGRGAQSELYRVTYVGDELTGTVSAVDTKFADAREHRQEFEKHHSFGGDDSTSLSEMAGELITARDGKELESGDRFLKTAVRNAFYNSDLLNTLFSTEDLLEMAKEHTARDPDDVPQTDLEIGVVLSLAKTPVSRLSRLGNDEKDLARWKSAAHEVAVMVLNELDFGSLTLEQKENYLRAMSLTWIRLGEPKPETAQALSARLIDYFPAADSDLNRELCQMLVYLNSPTVVAKTVALLNQPPQRDNIDMGDLLTRNAGYGRDINAMIANQPDQNQIWYAFCLRVAKAGWTPELRADYYRWFGRAQTWSGGNSFKKFLQNIEGEAWDATPFDHRVLVEAAGARTPYAVPELPKPTGPGKAWALEEVRALAQDGLKNRNFENGKKAFAATRCIVCHRFAGDGGATGPDLTQLAGRFNIEALTEAIMEPSKVISDQYRASTVATSAGKVIVGRIVSENDQQISVLTDPENSTKIVDIPKTDIDEVLPSKVSIMPADLLKPLNQDEVLDLLAYLLSRGDEKSGMFAK